MNSLHNHRLDALGPNQYHGFSIASIVVVLLLLMGCTQHTDTPKSNEWPVSGGDMANNQYSALAQITPANVKALDVAWTYTSGDVSPGDRTQIQCNPIIIDGVLYGTSPKLKVFALDAATGVQKWIFDPFDTGHEMDGPGINRGVVYWSEGNDRRILFAAGSYLFALDADDGTLISSFGEGGRVPLHDGLGRDVTGLYVTARSPGIVYKDLLIQGTSLSESPATAPGHIRAYNVRTGEIEWTFHTIPQPGEYGYTTWPEDAWQHIGGANVWTLMSLDEARGLVYLPTGSAAFDFWGGNRKGENLFANSLLVLNAATGERVWHFQTVHHDILDRDLPAAPNLVTVFREGEAIDAVAQITKSGYVFLFERETGEPLFPIEERPVPASTVPGEEAWPTQPIPTRPPPFSRQHFTEDLVTDISPASHKVVLDSLRKLRSEGPFTPASLQGSIVYPGFDGGAEWGGAAFDPDTQVLYVNANEMPWVLQMVDLFPDGTDQVANIGNTLYGTYCAACHGQKQEGNTDGSFPALVDLKDRMGEDSLRHQIDNGRGFMPSFKFLSESEKTALVAFLLDLEVDEQALGTELAATATNVVPFGHAGYNRFFDPEGYPAVKPPWGTLNAIDLNEGEILWKIPLGEFPELTARGVSPTGTENYGGPIVTAGGLIFIGATKDEKFRAFDKSNGALLWETDLPAGGYATPATYEVEGRQYVVIAAGGGKMGTKSGDTYVAYALPQ